ncbi:carbamoyl phosphate synthase large subunit, partial [Lasius niger]
MSSSSASSCTTQDAPLDALIPPNGATAALLLQNGDIFWGKGYGAKVITEPAELCFCTATTGYQETLTDPSFRKQIITFTFPHIGNTGINSFDNEASHISAFGLVTKELPTPPSSWRSEKTLPEWLIEQNRPGIAGIDTRRLVTLLRQKGPQNAIIAFPKDGKFNLKEASAKLKSWEGLESQDLAADAAGESRQWHEGRWQEPLPTESQEKIRVVALDFGAKDNILRSLVSAGAEVHVVPGTAKLEEIKQLDPQGIFLSNGPGDPELTGKYAVPLLQELFKLNIPIFGICMGHQLIARAVGAKTYRLPQGHRGTNHPVKELATGKVEITSQNHGFAVDPESLPKGVVQTHISLFDGSNEGTFQKTLLSKRWTVMPKRTDIKSILLIGAGPIVIGQGCEFDYSGAQACKALREDGYRIILVNSNPATIMTDPDLADKTYIEPITAEFLTRIIEKEKPDALLPTMGGQTALNAALELDRSGVLEKFGVELIGARGDVIDKAENRQKFREIMDEAGLESPKSFTTHTLEDAQQKLSDIGLPVIIRPSFTLGGAGGGIAYNKAEFDEIVMSGLNASPTTEVLVEESVIGWKEYEMEVVRDIADNCIIVCSIENIDPMGVHTGDSITVAPALTLTDKEFQKMRDASLTVLRKIGIETGGSNVQFAINPKDGRMVVIEMNPRVSRSSALASKATGFPIAKIAAKLAVGYTLDELDNDITGTTPASFEPVIDYVVTKIPRFVFEKFPATPALLSTSMKSVGEIMSIGRNFAESLQKGLRSLETGLEGLDDLPAPKDGTLEDYLEALATQRPDRLLLIAQAFRAGISFEQILCACQYDPWFLQQIQELVAKEEKIKKNGLPQTAADWRHLKSLGFSDKRLATLCGLTEKEVRTARYDVNVHPFYQSVDTCANEFDARTSYFYSSYEGNGASDGYSSLIREEEKRDENHKKIIILGGGPNRIGQGIEFDYCCVHAAYALRDAGYETIMVNCNPETVSTDYDTSDRLYFEPLTEEDVLEILRVEQKSGTLVGCLIQYGGQTPLKLSRALEEAGIPILGTSADAIDRAEDRERFSALLRKLDLKQPKNAIALNQQEVLDKAEDVGYPLVVRPSYVLGGRAMAIVHDRTGLEHYLREVLGRAGKDVSSGPVLLDHYLNDAIEVDVDCISDGQNAHVAGVMEHIEEAGIHSGDSACSLPPYSLSPALVTRL